jgi:hypothetical protein
MFSIKPKGIYIPIDACTCMTVLCIDLLSVFEVVPADEPLEGLCCSKFRDTEFGALLRCFTLILLIFLARNWLDKRIPQECPRSMIGICIFLLSARARDVQGFDQDLSIQEIELLSLSRPSGLTVQRGIRTWIA